MPPTPENAELLRRYADEKSEAAFAELVRRHVDLVYSVAFRQCGGDAHLAQDVAQQVFTDLARKAPALARQTVLVGWLYRSTHFAASVAVRTERRRRAREWEAHTMQELSRPPLGAAEWELARPTLDAAIAELDPRDRDAVLLRFFKGGTFADVGAQLRLTENAARMRVERALDKLHASLARRGITSTTAALGAALFHQASVAAPAGLAASVTSAALAGAAAAGGGGGALLTFLTMSKIKVGVVSALLLAGLATVVVDVRTNRGLRAEMRSLQAGGENPGTLPKENQRLNAALQKLSAGNPEAGELARLRQRASVLKARPPGVLDEKMISAANWRDVGRATPEAANMTFHWAMFTRDLNTVAKFVIFEDDTPESRAAFMAHFSPAVRAKYRTPERIVASALYGAGTNVAQPLDDAFQFLETDDHVGGNGSRFGQKHTRVWYRMASGKEFEGGSRWQQTPDGWLPAAFALKKDWEFAVPRFDPASGDRLLPETPGDSAPAKK